MINVIMTNKKFQRVAEMLSYGSVAQGHRRLVEIHRIDLLCQSLQLAKNALAGG